MPVVSLDERAFAVSPLFSDEMCYYDKLISLKFTKRNNISHCSQIQVARIQHLVVVTLHEDWQLSQ
jgi:hypothetical protein